MNDPKVAVDSDSTDTDGQLSAQQRRTRAIVEAAGAQASGSGVQDGASAVSPPRAYRRVNVRVGGPSACTTVEAEGPEMHGEGTIGLEAFGELWLAQPRFAFTLHTETSVEEGRLCDSGRPRPPYTATAIRGMAITWDLYEPRAQHAAVVYYLPLGADYAGARSAGGRCGGGFGGLDARDGACVDGQAAWLLVQTAMVAERAIKVADTLKQQCALLLSRGVHVCGRL